MIYFPNAKINLGLQVIRRRDDGYHNICSLFYPIPWCDILEVIPDYRKTGSITIESSGLPLACSPGDNLIARAYHIISKDYPLPALSVFLHKQIPMGAGLGGGSSDAAFFIKALNNLDDVQLAYGELHHYARKLGADCPFFISNRPAWVTGTGEQLEPAELNLTGFHISVVYPGKHMSTAEAYKLVKPATPKIELEEILALPVDKWKNLLINDFEGPVSQNIPEVRFIGEEMYKAGAVYASMTGSGSAVYGLFKTEPNLVWEREFISFAAKL